MALQARRSTVCIRSVPNALAFTFLRCASTTAGPFKAPPYPYGPSTFYRRRDSGLYGSATIQFGNLVSEQNEHKSRRVWRPNVHNKRLWSNYLGRFVKVKITSRVLRTLDKLGGLDEYLVGSDAPARIKELGVTGWELRWRIMQTRSYRDRVAVERRRLGLPERGWAVEEKERKREKKREAMRVAEAYLKAVKVERKEAREKTHAARSMEEALEQTTEQVVEDLEGSSAAVEQDEAETEIDPEFEVEEEEGGEEEATERNLTTAQVDEIEPLLPSQKLYAQLTAIATEIHSHPNSLLKQTRDMITDRSAQIATSDAQKTKLAAQRADLVSDIDAALASPRPGPILSLYNTLIAQARNEKALWRERLGKKPLTREQMELNVLGPPANVPQEKWAEVRKRVVGIQRNVPRRIQQRRERREAMEERTRYQTENWADIQLEKKRRWRRLGLFRRARYSFSNSWTAAKVWVFAWPAWFRMAVKAGKESERKARRRRKMR